MILHFTNSEKTFQIIVLFHDLNESTIIRDEARLKYYEIIKDIENRYSYYENYVKLKDIISLYIK